ncbi:hypothetical protein LLG90_18540 [Aromatoleum toluclasticum]|uniref:hypothetical protein n=1 Tax=Aromatoleum toluclasticum TaxID=92003 RepID=UPI0012FAC61F|nr:hypothetical protein [Aromatoleum toluclasticum]MCC4117356.1 hypothetical protein [Aromatoleum toluclasticum]
MPRKATAHEPAHAPPIDAAPDESRATWPFADVTAAWMGMPWVNLWMQSWATWLGQHDEGHPPARSSGRARSRRPERRHAELPWVPRIESTVIPFCRSEDEPGAEATRLSMRLRVPTLPWMGGSNVISIDTVMPHGPDKKRDD